MIEYITQWKNRNTNQSGCVATIGNFDGFHQGHQALIKRVCEQAEQRDLAPALLSFNPHPRAFFKVNQEPFRIISKQHSQRLLSHLGIKYYYHLPFDKDFATLSAMDFIQKILVELMNVKKVIVGADFRFGNNREGDVTLLKTIGQEKGFDVEIMAAIRDEHNYTISSTIVREALHEGDLEKANHLLNWPLGQMWEMEGIVIHGDKRGRTIGYPTANLKTNDYIHAKYGVYAVRVAIDDNSLAPIWHLGVANFGIRPMFEVKTPLLETYIFDFNEEIYDRVLRVQFVSYLRGEKNFNDLDALVKQIDQDCVQAKECLKKHI